MFDFLSSFSSFASDVNSVQQALGKYIVSPLNAFGLGGFVFDVEGTATANLTAEITDHYAEDNSFFQDHIAIRPKRIILKNYVGELVYRLDDSTNTPIQTLTQKLTTINNFLPALAAGAQQAIGYFGSGKFDISNQPTSQLLNQASSLYSAVKNILPPTSRQQQAYYYFKSLLEQKILISVQTPFEFMSNMALENVVAIQRDDSSYISDFIITLKEIRFASTKTTLFNSNIFQTPSNQNQESGASDLSPGLKAVFGLNNSTVQRATPIQNGSVNGQSVPIANFDTLKALLN